MTHFIGTFLDGKTIYGMGASLDAAEADASANGLDDATRERDGHWHCAVDAAGVTAYERQGDGSTWPDSWRQIETGREGDSADLGTWTGVPKITLTIDFDKASHPAPLYHRYSRQTSPQRAHVELRDGVLTADWDGETDGSVPMDVWHGRAFRWLVPNTLTGGQVESLLEEVLPLAQRVWDGLEIAWDGSNHVGSLDTDAQAAHDEIQRVCEDAQGDANVWDVGAWLQDTDARELRTLGSTTAEIVAAIERQADDDHVVLDGDVEAAVLRILADALETDEFNGYRVRYDPDLVDAEAIEALCAAAYDDATIQYTPEQVRYLPARPDLHGCATLQSVLAALGAELLDAE